MTVATIRQDIFDVLDNQHDIGAVYDYERWANEWDAFIDLYRVTVGTADVIRGWEIGYRGFTVVEPDTFSTAGHREHTFQLMGYYGVDDANESVKTAADQAEDICDALNADTVLHGSTYYDCSWAEFELTERLFGTVFVHHIMIPLVVTERAP